MGMTEFHLDFIKAIQQKKVITLRFFSKEDGAIIERTCAPMDYGPSRRSKDKSNRYHFWDIDSDKGSHVLGLLPEQIDSLVTQDKEFNPLEFVTWDTVKSPWFVARDWGRVS